MALYTLKRVAYMIVTIFVIIAITFFIMKLLPGTPYKNAAKLTPAQIEVLNEKYGLDEPIPVQFVQYVGNMVKGDLGISFQYDGRSVTKIISNKLPVSAQLGFEAMIVGVILGIILGIIASLRRGTILDYGAVFLAVLGISIPSFVFAQLLQYYVGLQWDLLPIAYWKGPSYHILPVIALAIGVIANISRFTRTEMVEVLNQDYITTAKAKGLRRFTVIMQHSIRNAMIPVITIVGPLAASIMTGSLVIENIFAIPGIGEQFVTSILTNDYPMIMGTTILISVAFVIVIFVTDMLYGVIDPRIRISGGNS
ncbi:oligopeptide ABC transporter permease [Tuberibacillus sp. Marseille-P3662]|uniref:oligopeptide ABC transporter permease n=1 Tax=Tuberibacillus sp. Marseille-P3662 TaxID=1965358 RepID=UPI000A1CC13A|nr:oligopeptide ABC transporter permease [Tuberibacillus sp. Marseille-P3662]